VELADIDARRKSKGLRAFAQLLLAAGLAITVTPLPSCAFSFPWKRWLGSFFIHSAILKMMGLNIFKKPLALAVIGDEKNKQWIGVLPPLLFDGVQIFFVIDEVTVRDEYGEFCILGVGSKLLDFVYLHVSWIQPLPFNMHNVPASIVLNNCICSVTCFEVSEIAKQISAATNTDSDVCRPLGP